MPTALPSERKQKIAALLAQTHPTRPQKIAVAESPFSHLDRKGRLESLVQQTLTEPSPTRRALETHTHAPRWQKKYPQFPPGEWCAEGFYPDGHYRVENLVDVWRAMYGQHQRKQEPPSWSWTLRPLLLAWLEKLGHEHCEQVLSFAVSHWEMLRVQFDLIEAEAPALNIIYGFRRGIERLMNKQQTQVPVWKGETMYDSCEAELTFR